MGGMSKHKKPKGQGSADNARARLAAERAAAERRRRRMIQVIVPLAVVVVAVGVLVGVKVLGIGQSSANAVAGDAAPVVQKATSVPSDTLNQVGAGSAGSFPKALDGSALTENGKPKILYVGAEYCPYCAAERWSMVVALSRFGTFSGLTQSHSSTTDVYPNTSTLSFHGSTYTSSTIAFSGVETSDEKGQPLETLSAADQQLESTYNSPPYVEKASAGAIPFIYIDGKYAIHGASYDPGILQGKNHQQIADALADPESEIAQGVDGTANLITAAICATTKDTPASVCSSAGVQAAAKKLS